MTIVEVNEQMKVSLHQDLSSVVLGVMVAAVGLIALGLSLSRWKHKDLFLVSFGSFSLLYGTRLLAESPTIYTIVGAPPHIGSYLIAFISYVLPIPLSGFLFLLFGRGWLGSMLWVLRASILFALAAILSDLIQATPATAMAVNNVLVVLWACVVVANALWPGLRVTRDLWIVLAGFLVFGLLAVNANLVALGILPWRWTNEPLGFVAFLSALGYVAAHRFFTNEKRLLAVEHEMETARKIQSSILPRTMPAMPGVDIAARYVPMVSVAGDFYDILTEGNKRLCVLVADVSGHGVGAALIGSMMKIAFLSQSQHLSSPARVLSGINQILSGKLEHNFVTACCLFLEPSKGTMVYANAGHPPPLLWRRARNAMYELGEHGAALGPFPRARYSNASMTIQTGDRILLYTDGITESRDASDDFFGESRLKEFIKDHGDLPATECAEALLKHLYNWSGKTSTTALNDDLTLMVIDILNNPRRGKRI